MLKLGISNEQRTKAKDTNNRQIYWLKFFWLNPAGLICGIRLPDSCYSGNN